MSRFGETCTYCPMSATTRELLDVRWMGDNQAECAPHVMVSPANNVGAHYWRRPLVRELRSLVTDVFKDSRKKWTS